jgi:hypothetical protein
MDAMYAMYAMDPMYAMYAMDPMHANFLYIILLLMLVFIY